MLPVTGGRGSKSPWEAGANWVTSAELLWFWQNRDTAVAISAARLIGGFVIRPLAAGRAVAAPWSVVKIVASIALLLTGCIFIDPINQRPSIGIQQETVRIVHRGDHVTLVANYDDPEGREGTYSWHVFACADASDAGHGIGCDAAFYTGTQSTAVFDVPLALAKGDPVQAIRVTLDARDDRGAIAQGLEVYPVEDALPGLELRKSAHSYTVGAPIKLFAKYGDLDDGPANVELDWQVFTPNTQPAFTFTDLAVAQDATDPTHVTAGKTLVPQGTGEWTVQVTARDPLGAMTMQPVSITVAADQPPCLAQWQPIVPLSPALLPVSDPTVFQVPLVDDDFDVYPPVAGDPVLGTTTFAWSILPPGASTRQPLTGATGNSLDFDPSAFTPGDIVELRVEIFDRTYTTLPCADGDAVCSVGAQPGCIQRQTWRVEVR